MEESKSLLDVELGQSPRYSTIAASPPGYYDALPSRFEPVHFRQSHQSEDEHFMSYCTTRNWPKQEGIRKKARSLVRKLVKAAIAMLLIIALAIVFLLILLRVRAG